MLKQSAVSLLSICSRAVTGLHRYRSQGVLSQLLLLLLTVLLNACQVTPSRPLVVSDGIPMINSQTRYSNDAFAVLVAKYTDTEGQVNYEAWSHSVPDLLALEHQVALLAQLSPDTHSEQFADRAAVRSYWVNTYNTLVVHKVLQFWPLDSVRDVKVSASSFIIPGKGFFYDHEVTVGGEKTNLYDLEKKILRTQQDPRLHFALNCASSSCPVLQPWEWTEEQLDHAAAEFINNRDNVRVAQEALYLSRIFKWYKEDFGDDIYAFLLHHADSNQAADIHRAQQRDYPLRYLKYDWDINTATPAGLPDDH